MNERPEFTTGASKLANTIKGMIKSVAEPPVVIDFGVINADYSLTTNRFPCPIPKENYSVCRQLLYDPSVPLTQTYVDGTHSHPGAGEPGLHFHEVILPTKMHWIKPGQKCLVAWVQNEACIIDIVYDGKWLGDCEPPW